MASLLSSILGSLVAGILLIVIAPIVSKKARHIMTLIFGSLLGIDVLYVYHDFREAQTDLMSDLDNSSFIKMIAGRGNELQRETFNSVFRDKEAVNFKILLPRDGRNPSLDWIRLREMELETIDKGFKQDTLRNQIRSVAKFLENYIANNSVELKYYDAPHIGRVILLQNCCYFTPYKTNAHGANCKIIKYKRGGETYETFDRLFDLLWKQYEMTNPSMSTSKNI